MFQMRSGRAIPCDWAAENVWQVSLIIVVFRSFHLQSDPVVDIDPTLMPDGFEWPALGLNGPACINGDCGVSIGIGCVLPENPILPSW